MESSSVNVCEAVSSVLCTLEEQRKLAYSRSSIQLVSELENKYPLSDVIMRSYTGTKIKGNLEGPGTVEFKDGHTYEGDFHQGVMHGRGRYVWKDGLIYEGEFYDCKITGVGKYTWPNGSTYTGEVRDGLRHGQGTYWCVATGSTYTGQWVAGRRQGRGRLCYNNQSACSSGAREAEEEEGEGVEESYYDGEWVDNQQEGFGTRRYRSGNVYEGEWHCNERHGRGTMHWYDRGERYSGQWVRGIQQGQGEHVWIIQGSDNAQYPLCNRYDGEWNQGKREGFGTFYYANGSKYIGEWYQDLKHGRGKFVFQSGQVFEGQFHKDKMVGGCGSTGAIGAQEAGLIRPQTPLGSLIGDIDHSDFMSGGSITEKFNFQISKLLSETNADYELKQIHCILLRHITQLKKIYHHYSSLGSSPAEIGKRGCTLTQMQLWRLWRDCKIHHQGITLYDVNNIVYPDSSSSTTHNPNRRFLMREFLQLLVYLSNSLISDPQEKRVGGLSQKLSSFITTHLLPCACQVGGSLYSKPPHWTKEALTYQQDVWHIYQQIQSTNKKHVVKLRDILLLLEGRGLVTSSYPARSVVQELVKDNPLAVDEQDYNLEIKVTFLEFFEILLQCAEGWYSKYREQLAKDQRVMEQQLSLPVLLVTSDPETIDKAISNEHTNNTVVAAIETAVSSRGETPKQEIPAQHSSEHTNDDARLDQQTSAELEQQLGGEESMDRAESEDKEAAYNGSPEQPGEEELTSDDGTHTIQDVLIDEAEWKDLLQTFFKEHLLAN